MVGSMASVYFDTEFAGLFAGADLVSIGFVTQDGCEIFYAELTDTYDEDLCSEFCRSEVLPLLDGGVFQRTYRQLQSELYVWLRSRGEGTILVCDSWRDVEQIRALFPDGLPENCECLVLDRWSRLRRRLANFRGRLYRRHGLRHHHALDDAKANRLIFGSKGFCSHG
jgi:hypothetical protein